MKFSKKCFNFRVQSIFVLFLSMTITLYGQNRLIKPSLSTFSTLSTAENLQLSKFQSSTMYTNFNLVDFGNLEQMQNQGKITINIPNDDCDDLIFRVLSIDYVNEQNYYWYGILQSTANENDCNCSLGSITLISSQFGRIGYISVDDNTYELLELSSNRFVLAKLDGSKFTESECGVTNTTPSANLENIPSVQTRDIGNCNVRCLVLYTDNALAAEGSLAALNNRVNLAIAQTNQALRNSWIDDSELRIELAGVQPLEFNETQFIRNDINSLTNNLNAQNLRDIFEADIVVLLTDGEYGSTFGIVRMIGPNEGKSYAIVQTGAATTGRFTFAHEVAHLFGGGHNDDPRPGIPHGHKFKTGNFMPCIFGKSQRTILNLAGENDVRIQHFSNPIVTFDGQKTGVSGKKDNAQQLRNTSCQVAQFRETIRPFSANITGDINTCPCGAAFLGLNITGGTAGATYTYLWERSTDGINWTVFSNFSTAFIPSTGAPHHQCPEEDYIFVRVLITSNDNQQTTASTTIARIYEWPGQEEPCLNQPFTNNGDINNITLFPNPTIGYTEGIFTVTKQGIFTIKVNDSYGRLITTIIDKKLVEEGEHNFSFNLSQPGLYFIQSVNQEGETLISKLIKI